VEDRVFTDTTEFCSIDCGDIIQVGEKRYRVTGHERERRFGVDDPKFWVKRVVDTNTGEKKILKLSFFESFDTKLGGVKIRCFRNPEKEADILSLVKGHPHFMQGTSQRDSKDNNIRVLDIVRGLNFFVYIDSLTMSYESYFHEVLPDILRKLTKAFEAIRFLHVQGFKHGDIRNDHLIVERESGDYVWIDFDFDYATEENPYSLDIFGLGNILLYTVGKGFHNLYAIKNDRSTYGGLIDRLETGDFSILDKWRLMNLRKLYPFISPILNDILLHFSRRSELFYELSEELIEDLNRCMYSVFQQ
jgi:serine/threonine protein kinase